MINILLIGISTGLDLENTDGDPGVTSFVDATSLFTTVVFTVECLLKLAAEGEWPTRYFTDPENGAFNCLDFAIVVGAYAFMNSSNGSAVGAVRMLRLARLLTFIKGVKQLRVIVSGLIQGMMSVVYIVILLFLVIYIFAIVACLMFGDNDPARFGSIGMSMVTLFQVSPLSPPATWCRVGGRRSPPADAPALAPPPFSRRRPPGVDAGVVDVGGLHVVVRLRQLPGRPLRPRGARPPVHVPHRPRRLPGAHAEATRALCPLTRPLARLASGALVCLLFLGVYPLASPFFASSF